MMTRTSLRLAHAAALWCLLSPLGAAVPNPKVQAHLGKAQQALQANQPGEAAREFQAVLALDPNQVEARASLGMIAFLQEDFRAAAVSLREAVKLRPTLWKARALLGISLKRTGDIQSGRVEIEKAFPNLSEEPKLRIKAGLELLEIYYQTGELAKAAETAGALQRLAPADMDVLYAAYHTYSKLAEGTLAAMAAAAPDSARMHQLIGQRRAVAGDIKGAIDHYGKAAGADPQLPGVHFEYGQALLLDTESADALTRARAEFQAALAANPQDFSAHRQLGEVLSRLGEHEPAVKHFARALKLAPDDAEAHFGLGKLYAAAGDLEKARIHFEAATRLDAGNALAHYRLGSVYQRLGRSADADLAMARFEELKKSQRATTNLLHELGLQPRTQSSGETLP